MESFAADGYRPVADLVPMLDQNGKPFESEETLIADNRADLGPAKLVENKLSTLLGERPLPVSHVRMAPRLGGRGRS